MTTGSAASEIVERLLDHLDAMVAYWDRDEVCLYANEAYRLWFGKARDEVVGMTMEGVLGAHYVANGPYIRAAFAGQRQVFERDITSPDGVVRHALATYIPDIVNGAVQGIYVHVADVTPLKKLERELRAAKERAEHLATHDPLTGLPNRMLLVDRLEQGIALSRREQKILAVLSLDVDDFKNVNDTWGHAEGDRVLVRTAGRLKRAMRESDSVTRMGGDEFILLAPGLETEGEVEALVTRLRDDFGAPFRVDHEERTMSLSIGAALYPRDGTTPAELLAAADRALYASKRQRRQQAAETSHLRTAITSRY